MFRIVFEDEIGKGKKLHEMFSLVFMDWPDDVCHLSLQMRERERERERERKREREGKRERENERERE